MAESDPFFRHDNASQFMEEAMAAYDATGVARIPHARAMRMAVELGLSEGEAGGMAYLAGHRVQEFFDDLSAADPSLEAEAYLMLETER